MGTRRATLNNKDGSKKYVRICRIMLETYRPKYHKDLLKENNVNINSLKACEVIYKVIENMF